MNYEIWIDGSKIKDSDSFHNEFQEKMGFFDGYGRNINAWIDCMRDIYTNGQYQSLSMFNLYQGDSFTCNVINAQYWITNDKDSFEAFTECFAWLQKQESGDYLLKIFNEEPAI